MASGFEVKWTQVSQPLGADKWKLGGQCAPKHTSVLAEEGRTLRQWQGRGKKLRCDKRGSDHNVAC